MTIWFEKVEIDGHTVQLASDKEGGHITGYSFATGKYYSDPLDMLPKDYKPARVSKTKEQTFSELKEINSYKTLPLPARGLRKETLERFGIRTAVSEEDGETITSVHFPYRKGGKGQAFKTVLTQVKKMWWTGKSKGCDPFGWEQAVQSGSPKLYITEGEYDAAALYQVLIDNAKGGKWADLEPAVISIKDGAGSAVKFLSSKMTEINKRFKEVTLVFDMDGPGQAAAKEVSMIMPGAKVASLPAKDANACLIEGRSKALCNAVLWNATKTKNTRTVSIDTLFDKARAPAKMGLSWPWKKMTALTRGIRFGETIYITGTAKIGKSDVLNTIVAHLVKVHQIKCFVCKPEEANVKSVKMIAGKLVGKIFHDPLIPFDDKAYDEAIEYMRGKVELVNIFQNVEWDTLKGDITAAAVDGCRAVFIDPLTVLTTGMSSSEANVKLQEIAQNLSSLALDLDIVIFIFTHLKNPAHGDQYDRGGKINVGDITGSRGMTRSCNQIIGIQGNNDPELEDEDRNLRDLVLLADREHGAAGIVHLWWDKLTSLFKEMK